jgi:hypothetical protein
LTVLVGTLAKKLELAEQRLQKLETIPKQAQDNDPWKQIKDTEDEKAKEGYDPWKPFQPNPWKAPPPPWKFPKFPDPYTLDGPKAKCGVCGIEWTTNGGWGYVCSHTNCPTRVSCSTVTLGEQKDFWQGSCECGVNVSCQCKNKHDYQTIQIT